jgi:hypothetical protein
VRLVTPTTALARRARANRENEFPLGGGEIGALVRELDWSKTSGGPISA